MRDHTQQCPFLNRRNPACSANLSIDRLRHAFTYCFDQYRSCPLYGQLVVERRMRQNRQATGAHDASSPLVQVAVVRRHKKPVSVAA